MSLYHDALPRDVFVDEHMIRYPVLKDSQFCYLVTIFVEPLKNKNAVKC